jgi:hypothetical protein
MQIAVGTKVRTTYQHSETGVICRPTKASLPMPGPDWYIIKFDADGGKLCIHREMFNVAN